MKKLLLLAIVAVAAVMTGCTTVNDNRGANDFAAEILPAKFQTIVEHKDQLVYGEAQLNALFCVFTWGVSEFSDRSFDTDEAGFFASPFSLVKQAATYNACQEAKCDVLLNAKYTITVTDYVVFKKINCKVSGYPGTEKGIKAVK